MLNPYDKYDKKTLDLIKTSAFRTEGSGIYKIFLDHAKRSSNRALKAREKEEFEEEISESASSVLFSALSCESIVSEYITHFEFSSSEVPDELLKLRSESDPLAKWKVLLKHGEPNINLSSNISYLKLSCLIKLRNCIAHRKARLLKANSFPEEIAPCIKQKIIPEPSEFRGTWILTILNHDVATWAYEAAKEWLDFANNYVVFRDA